MTGSCILVVEDEQRIADLLERGLREAGYRVERASNGKQALELWRAVQPELILLDIMIPEPDGFEVLRRIRQVSDVPVIVLSARAEEIDRVVGLELGADDYVIKPFSPREVLLRIKTVLRRLQPHPPRSRGRVTIGELSLDLEAFTAQCQGKPLSLTRNHFALLAHLANPVGRAFTRAELCRVMGENLQDERTIDTHIRNLRTRLGDCGEILETVRGVGYRLKNV